MSRFRPGTFEREEMPAALRHFSPQASINRVEDVDLEVFKETGKKLVLLDVDNTLIPWRGSDIPQSVHDWIAKGKSLGLEFCILSNTRHPERLERLSEELKIEYIRAKFKPSKQMYHMALEKYGATPDEAVMVGDQLLTDILGANRTGIDAVWIRPITKREFIGTRLVSRNIERMIGRLLHNYFQPADASAVLAEKPGFFQHNIVRQFLKFCMIGGLSTLIDIGLHYLLMFKVPMGDTTLAYTVGEWVLSITSTGVGTEKDILEAAFAPLKIPVVLLAIFNSYYWNRRWTFRVDKEVGHGSMIAKFYTVALIGMVINVGISTSVYRLLALSPEADFAGASLVAIVVVVFWNFFGQKLWTFRKAGK